MQDHVTGFTSGKAFTVTVTAMVRILSIELEASAEINTAIGTG